MRGTVLVQRHILERDIRPCPRLPRSSGQPYSGKTADENRSFPNTKPSIVRPKPVAHGWAGWPRTGRRMTVEDCRLGYRPHRAVGRCCRSDARTGPTTAGTRVSSNKSMKKWSPKLTGFHDVLQAKEVSLPPHMLLFSDTQPVTTTEALPEEVEIRLTHGIVEVHISLAQHAEAQVVSGWRPGRSTPGFANPHRDRARRILRQGLECE